MARFSPATAPATESPGPEEGIQPPAVENTAQEALVAPPRVPVGLPADAVIVVADEDAYTDTAMKGPPYMWTWIGATTWYYVKDYQVPVMFGR
jgi:hypothetical protein